MTNARPIVGLVLNYCDPARTSACVRSLIESGVDKVLIFDNSGAALGRVSRAHMASLGSASIEVVFSEYNLGFAAGVNRGMDECAARWPEHWVLLVNNDAIVPPDLAVNLAHALCADGSAAIAFPAVRHQGTRVCWSWYQPHLGLITRQPLPGSFCFASGCCQLIAPERIGDSPFDEDFFMYGEDVELAWRLAQRNLGQVLVQHCEVVHEGSASSRRGSLFYETLVVECHLRLAEKVSVGRAGRRAILLAFRSITLPSRAVARALRSGSLAPIQGLFLGARRAFRTKSSGREALPPHSTEKS